MLTNSSEGIDVMTSRADQSQENSEVAGLTSDETVHIFKIVVQIVLCGGIGLFGIVANILNIVIFTKQGFQDSVNISLLGLAVADLLCVITMFWTSVCSIIRVLDLPPFLFEPTGFLVMTGAYPRLIVTRVTCWMTALISLERCLCVALPFKVKFIFTPKNTAVMVIAIFMVIIPLYGVSIYNENVFLWKFNPKVNTSHYVMHYMVERAGSLARDTVIYTIMPLINMVIVILCALVLVVKLKLSLRWREKSIFVSKTTEETSIEPMSVNGTPQDITSRKTYQKKTGAPKEAHLTKMITTLTIIFIVCYLPSNIILNVSIHKPEFITSGKYNNSFVVSTIFAFLMETINSSVNIFVYYLMSSKFKTETRVLFFGKLAECP